MTFGVDIASQLTASSSRSYLEISSYVRNASREPSKSIKKVLVPKEHLPKTEGDNPIGILTSNVTGTGATSSNAVASCFWFKSEFGTRVSTDGQVLSLP